MPESTLKKLRLSGLLAVFLVLTGPIRAQVVISEFMAENSDTLEDEDGDSSDWIELHNESSGTVNLLGWSLTDDASGSSVWGFPSVNLPADAYLVVFASNKDRVGAELHTDFKLSSNGEYLALYPLGGGSPTTEFSPSFPEQREDLSYGETTLGVVGFLDEPTPGEENTSDLRAARDVDFDISRGFFDSPVTVTLTCEESGAEIRYTTDGSEPGVGVGQIYSAPLTFNGTTCVRAVGLQLGMAPSRVSTRTYLFTADVLSQDQAGAIAGGFPAEWTVFDGTPWTTYDSGTHPGAWYGYDTSVMALHTDEELREALLSIPSVSLVMSMDDWFGYNPPAGPFGIYPNIAYEGAEWERAVSMEWIEPESDDGFQINCEVAMQGGSGSSITYASQGSMAIKFKKAFGPTELEYQLFEDLKVDEFDTLILDSGNQNSIHANAGLSTKRHAQCMRDQFMMDLQDSIGQPAAAGRHAHVFINGLYWGLYNLHERPDEDWAANHAEGSPEEYDWVKEGHMFAGNNHDFDHPTSPGSWKTAIEIAANGLDVGDMWLGTPSYEALQEKIDLENYIDYMLINFYGGHLDWPGQNWMATSHTRNSDDFADVNPLGRFRFHSWDAETTLNWVGVTAVNDGWYDRTYVGTGTNEDSSAYLYGKLRNHPEFRVLFADRAQRMLAPGGGLYVAPGAEVAGTTYVLGQNAPADLYYARSSQIETAVRLTFARWGNYFHAPGSVSAADWNVERARILEDFFPVRSDVLVQQLRAATPSLYPTIDAPVFSQHGGHMDAEFGLIISNASGAVYYTIDGSDPRLEGGFISPSALLYSGPILLPEAYVQVRARALFGAEWSAEIQASFSRVRISEIMARNESGLTDEQGELEDWVELSNESLQSVDLSGWFLSDDPLNPREWEIPSGTVLAPGALLLVWADNDVTDGPLHASFQLSSAGESLSLSAPLGDSEVLVDSISFGLQLIDQSQGRMPTSGDTFVRIMDPSPSGRNEPSPGEAVRFAALAAPEVGPSLTANSLPFAGQIVPLFVQGLSSGAAGVLKVGSSLTADVDLVSDRIGGVEQLFQSSLLGSVNLSALLPRRSSRLQPGGAIPVGSVFYLQAVSRSELTNGVAVCVQN
ncbi:MAG: lamin tail domain-containing protein [Planctomycetota bacterium]|nr:lamin tail domain-containing protein [Planctomycetota bacterium]